MRNSRASRMTIPQRPQNVDVLMPIEVRRPDAGANDLPDLRRSSTSISDRLTCPKAIPARGAASQMKPASSIH